MTTVQSNCASTMHPDLKSTVKDEQETFDFQSISQQLEGLKLNENSISKSFDDSLLLRKLSATKSNSVLDKPETDDEEDEDCHADSIKDGLIARGPCTNKLERNKNNTHPYSRPWGNAYSSDSMSPSSSQDSPPIVVEDRSCSSGGAMTLSPGGINLMLNDIMLDESQPISPPNRHQYMHKNGGNMQVAKPMSNIVNLPRSPYLVHTPPPSHCSSVSMSPVPSPSGSSINSVLTIESDSMDSLQNHYHSTDDEAFVSSSNELSDEVPDEIVDFLVSYPPNKNKLNDPHLYDQKVTEILTNLDNDEKKPQREPVVLPVTLLEEETFIQQQKQQQLQQTHPIVQAQLAMPQLTTSFNGVQSNLNTVNYNQPVVVSNCVPINNRQQVTVVLVSSEASTGSRRQPRPIKPKLDLSRGVPIVATNKVNPPISNSNVLRDSILGKYPESVRKQVHCDITKCTDEELHQVDSDGDTQLHIAIANKMDVPSVFLIDRFSNSKNLDLNVINHNKETPLYCAVHQKLPLLVGYLLAKGADPNISCLSNGGTALHFAARGGKDYFKTIEALGTCPSLKIDAIDISGRTPLHWAVDSHGREISVQKQRVTIDSLPCIRYLLKRGASVMCHENLGGKTAVHMALERKSLAILQIFFEEYAPVQKAVNKLNFSGHAPLHFVATMNAVSESEQARFAQMLIKMGACVRSTNREHKCPADLVDRDRKEVRNILLPSRQRNK